jgi:hypothetical protein
MLTRYTSAAKSSQPVSVIRSIEELEGEQDGKMEKQEPEPRAGESCTFVFKQEILEPQV